MLSWKWNYIGDRLFLSHTWCDVPMIQYQLYIFQRKHLEISDISVSTKGSTNFVDYSKFPQLFIWRYMCIQLSYCSCHSSFHLDLFLLWNADCGGAKYAREQGIPVIVFPKAKNSSEGLSEEDLVGSLRFLLF